MTAPSFRPQLTIPQWLELPPYIRMKLAKLFNIKRSTGAEVHNNVLVSDGHTHKDLATVTVEKMQEYTGRDTTDFYELLNLTIGKVYDEYESDINSKVAEQNGIKDKLNEEKLTALQEYTKDIENYIEELGLTMKQAPKKRGRPKKV